MTQTQQLNTKWQLAGALILASVVWLSIALTQCVYADSIEYSAAHDSSNCALHDNNPIKKDKDCVDCNSSLITLTTQENTFSQKYHYELEDQPNLIALASLYTPQFTIGSKCNANAVTQLDNDYSPPIYLKNCVFLN